MDTSTACRAALSRALCPHILVTASPDTQELCQEMGFSSLRELLAPFGDKVPGRVTVRDSQSASLSLEDFSVRFVEQKGKEDKLDRESELTEPLSPAALRSLKGDGQMWMADRTSDRTRDPRDPRDPKDPRDQRDQRDSVTKDLFSVADIETLLEARLDDCVDGVSRSALYEDVFRRVVAPTPVTAFETFGHPVTGVIAISSRNTTPIESLSALYTQSQWPEPPAYVNKEYLRYYVLVHDEQSPDLDRSVALFEKMKRNFGLHCHMVRVNRAQTESQTVEPSVYDFGNTSSTAIHPDDYSALQTFVRELVTQSTIPFMERCVATWTDQVAATKRGLAGRLFSVSRKYFVSPKTTAAAESSQFNGNYNATQAHYNSSTPEAQIRKLADFAFMLRDYRFAHTNYELLKRDFHNDKAWEYLAAVQEISALAYLLSLDPTKPGGPSASAVVSVVDPLLDSALYSYLARTARPTYALRCVLACSEVMCTIPGLQEAAQAPRWLLRALDDKLLGRLGYAMLMERVASASQPRARKAAFWMLLAAREWHDAGRMRQCRYALDCAAKVYDQPWTAARTGLLGRLRLAVEVDMTKS